MMGILRRMVFCEHAGTYTYSEAYLKHRIALSDKGWTNDYICTQWFEHSFVPQAKEKNQSGQPILLIYDGHHSHETIEIRGMAEKVGIHLFCIPPHTSHCLQPLDVGVFGPVQRAWQKRCLAVLEEMGESLARPDVVKEYLAARADSVDSDIILTAWRKSGIRPLNPGVFTEKDFAASFTSSINLPFPSSFPVGPNRLASPSDEENEDMESDTHSGSGPRSVELQPTPDWGLIGPTHLPVLANTTTNAPLLNPPPQNAPYSTCLHHQEGGEPSNQSRPGGQPSGACTQTCPTFITPDPVLRQTRSMSRPMS